MHLEHPHLVDTKFKRILVWPKAWEFIIVNFFHVLSGFLINFALMKLIDYSKTTDRIFNLYNRDVCQSLKILMLCFLKCD